jgi:hypothetical protein
VLYKGPPVDIGAKHPPVTIFAVIDLSPLFWHSNLSQLGRAVYSQIAQMTRPFAGARASSLEVVRIERAASLPVEPEVSELCLPYQLQ